MVEAGTESRFLFVGNQLCLDFVNTQVVASGSTVDLLGDFDGLLAWSREAGILSDPEAGDLAARWRGDALADLAFAKAVAFRDALRTTAQSVAGGGVVPEQALVAINDLLRSRKGHLEIARTGTGFETRFRHRFAEPADVLVPIAEAAAELLSDGDLSLVKKCESAACILYFYDTTKNHGRRWCSMAACGNRAKVAAHYHRTRRRPG